MKDKDNLDPLVLHPIALSAFILHILDHHAQPTTLIICSTRAAFLQQLHSSLFSTSSPNQSDSTSPQPHPLLVPTLHNLSAAGTINLAFCPDLPTLQAYLSAHAVRSMTPVLAGSAQVSGQERASGASRPLLALLNPLALHRPTSSFSAQGLGRTFSAAVEAAARGGQRLVVVECVEPSLPGLAREDGGDRGRDGEGEEDGMIGREEVMEGEGLVREELGVRELGEDSSWDEQVAILNVTTRSFGVGERGWSGRTVSVKRVVGRWCRFGTLEEL